MRLVMKLGNLKVQLLRIKIFFECALNCCFAEDRFPNMSQISKAFALHNKPVTVQNWSFPTVGRKNFGKPTKKFFSFASIFFVTFAVDTTM